MYGLPESTEVMKQLPKVAIYRKYNLSAREQALIDTDVSRLDIVNEISARTTTLAQGTEVSAFFVVKVQVKRQDYNQDAIIKLFSLIGQKCIFALSMLGNVSFACNNQRLFTTDWILEDKSKILLSGVDVEQAWNNVQASIIGVDHVEETSLDFQVKRKIRLLDMNRELEKLKKNEKKEVQPRKKQEIHSRVVQLRKDIEELESNPLMA